MASFLAAFANRDVRPSVSFLLRTRRCSFRHRQRALVTDLGRTYRAGRLDRRMRVYLAPRVLVIDEMGCLPLDEMGATIFFQLVSARYERGSIILTSNKSHGDWGTNLRRSHYRDGDPGSAAPPLDDDQYPRRKLPAERSPASWAAAIAGAGGRGGTVFRSPGLRFAQSAPTKVGAGLRSVRGHGKLNSAREKRFMGGGILDRNYEEFSTGIDRRTACSTPFSARAVHPERPRSGRSYRVRPKSLGLNDHKEIPGGRCR
jgi:hypothetical protein